MQTKEIQGKLWSTAPGYWSTYFEPYFLPLYKKALRQLSLSDEDMLLDAGCGSGMFCRMAANTGALVTGTDAAHGLLEIARERNPGINFLEEDLESLPFSPESFDFVTGFNSFQFAGNFVSAISEAKRVLKTGGRLLIGIWDKPEYSDASHILKAIGSLMPAPAPGTPGPFAMSEEGKIEAALDQAGMNLVYQTRVSCPFFFHTLEDGIKCFMGTGPAAAATNHSSEARVRETIANAFQPYHITEEMYHLENSLLIFIAEK